MIKILYECIKDIIEWIINFFCKIIIIINIFKQMNNSHLLKTTKYFYSADNNYFSYSNFLYDIYRIYIE